MENIRNGSGKVIGMIDSQNGQTTLRESNGKVLGYYDEDNNITRDVKGNVVGYCNNLNSLLKG